MIKSFKLIIMIVISLFALSGLKLYKTPSASMNLSSDNWQMIKRDELNVALSEVSTPSYNSQDWMPATVPGPPTDNNPR